MKKPKTVSLIVLVMLLVVTGGCKKKLGEMTDARDGQTYKTVLIGDQTWLAQDLNFEADNSSCYDDDPANCDIYGRLYDWETALTACPAGWHLPSDEEWSALIKFLDPNADPQTDQSVTEESKIAGGMLKARGNLRDETGLWNYPNEGATNSSKFSAVPGGVCYDDGSCDVMGRHAIYWTSTENDNSKVIFRVLDYGLKSFYRAEEDQWGMVRETSLSVRCLKD